MTRLYGILARDADTAVIFRRGPSRHVLLILWDLKTHGFTPGQWLEGRIYGDKSDLSPDGTRLVYLAAKHSGPIPTWVAVSRPPYLTAHVLWEGDGTWNGISLFETNDRLALSAGPAPAPGFTVPPGLEIVPNPSPGHFHILADHSRLVRDGWSPWSGDPVYHPNADVQSVAYRKPIDGRNAVELRACLSAKARKTLSYAVVHADGETDLQADWADVRGRDVLYARGGRLFRLSSIRQGKTILPGDPVQLADFSDLAFEAVLPPGWAKPR